MTCAPGQPVCNVLVAGPAGVPPTYTCGPLPEQCQAATDPDCSCFGTELGCDCVEGPDDRFEITCYAP